MKCLECGATYVHKSGHLELNDKYIGRYEVENVHYYKCNHCEDYLFPQETARRIREKKNEYLNLLIRSYSLESFFSAAETADYLGISRQALHKHRRIRRGFIFQTRFGGKKCYLKKSVELFKDMGDGRFPLYEKKTTLEKRYIKTESVPVFYGYDPFWSNESYPLPWQNSDRIGQQKKDISYVN